MGSVSDHGVRGHEGSINFKIRYAHKVSEKENQLCMYVCAGAGITGTPSTRAKETDIFIRAVKKKEEGRLFGVVASHFL